MGDTSINTKEEFDEQPKEESTDESSPISTSVEILRECKPSENISINNSASPSNVDPEPVSPESITTVKKPSTIETVFEKLDISDKSDSNSDSTAGTDVEKDLPKASIDTPPLTFDIKEKASDRNKSDIFSLDEKVKNSNTIFSIKV